MEKVENGALKVLAADSVPYVTGQTYQMEILVQGSMLEIWADRTLLFSVTDTSFNGGTIALYSSWDKGSIFDDILVKDLAGSVLPWENFDDRDFTGWTLINENGTTEGPSVWSAVNGAVIQTGNIGFNGSSDHGTFALY